MYAAEAPSALAPQIDCEHRRRGRRAPDRLSRMQRAEGKLTKDEFERINTKADAILKTKSED